MVLSTSKNAAAVGSGGTARLSSTSAAAAEAAPARTARTPASPRRERPGTCRARGTGPPRTGWRLIFRQPRGTTKGPRFAAGALRVVQEVLDRRAAAADHQ